MAKRSRAKERKQERQQQRKRNQQLLIVTVIVVVVIFVAAAFLLTSIPAEAPLPDTIARYENLRKGFTDEEGYPRLGNPNAPVTLKEFSSFSCSACLSFEQNVFSRLLPRIESGEIQFVFVPQETGSVRNPEGANRTAMCAGEQGKFWEMHDTLFSWHSTFGSNAFDDARLRAGVEALGLDMSAFTSCFRSNDTNTVLNTALGEGVNSTPTIHIDGAVVEADFDAITEAIDSKGPFTNLEPGTISDASTDDTSSEDANVEATDEAMTDAETEATDEAMVDDAEATDEAIVDDAESTDEAMVDDAEATDEAMTDAEAEATDEATDSSD